MKAISKIIPLLAICILLTSCDSSERDVRENNIVNIELEDVARILSSLPIGTEQMQEVHDAVNNSTDNGYDEEYMMCDLFKEPGTGVGGKSSKSVVRSYELPLRDLISNHLRLSTKSTAQKLDAEAYLSALESSDIQIYWPYSENWDGKSSPIITFDPTDGSEYNIGYKLIPSDDGGLDVEEVIVGEEMAKSTPVWVVNRNSDSSYTSLEMLRRQEPAWDSEGGTVIIGKAGTSSVVTKTGTKLKTLILKEFTARRNYDPWFAGASEFFVKCGSVEDFTASTEAELLLYNPSITDFMIVVKRSQIGTAIPFNAVLVSQWTDQLNSCAFMISEDDGGTMTSWKCSAEVKLKSKAYGFDINIPFRTRDDVVWRGQLSSLYLEKYSDTLGHFGDVDLKFELIEY